MHTVLANAWYSSHIRARKWTKVWKIFRFWISHD